MFRSATFKLTMWYLAIVMAISLVFSVVLYNVATGELSRGLDRETQRIYSQFPVFQGNRLLRPGADYNNGARRILLRLVGFNLVVLATSGYASYWLARRTLEPIEQAHEQQKRFTADVSHELRTPLTALRMETEVALLNKELGKPELRTTMASNLEEITKLEVLINNLLRLSRLEADELQQHFASVNSTALVTEAIQQVEGEAAKRGVKISSDIKKVVLQGDHDSLVQLLVILLDNAVKYSPPKTSVIISTSVPNGSVQFSVADKGPGIPRADLERVFERFYRADQSRNQSTSEGQGLGLSIAKMIADVHQGSISLTSRPGHGTTATLKLPLSPSSVTPASP